MMHLYSSVIQPSQQVLCSAVGRFTSDPTGEDDNYDEIVVSYGTSLAIFAQIQVEEDNIKKIASTKAYAHIFNIAALLLPELKRSHLVISSDSGNIVILDLKDCKFTPLVSIPYGRTGLRKEEPGIYLSVSPCGRAIFSSALEKFKLAWTVSKDEKENPVLSAPLENTRNKTFVYSTVALDVGYESPKFCCIEIRKKRREEDEPEERFDAKNEPKLLTFYQLDTNINFLVRCGKREEDIPLLPTTYMLVAVPGPLFDAPGGVIAVSTGIIQYYSSQGVLIDALQLPKREESESVIIANAVFKGDKGWFILLQNQFGDLLIINMPEEKLQVQYFDTVPVASSMCILSQGTFAVFGSNGVNKFYYITSIPEPLEEAAIEESLKITPKEELTNLTEFDEQQTMTRLTKLMTVPSSHESQAGDIVTIHGSGANSSLKITRRGISSREVIKITVGGAPTFVKALKKDPFDVFDKFIILSHDDKTRVFEFNEETRKLTDYSGKEFIKDSPTLEVFLMPTFQISSICQIHAGGIHIIEQNGETHDWVREGRFQITQVTANANQIAICFDDGTITLFETDQRALPIEVSSFRSREISGEITAIAIPQTPDGIRLADWLAIATNNDEMFVVYIVNIKKCHEQWTVSSSIVVNYPVNQMRFLFVEGISQILHIGHVNGLLTRATLDSTTGRLSNSQSNFLSMAPVTFSNCTIKGTRSLMINAGSPWIARGMKLTKFSTTPFVASCQYNAPFFPEGGYIGLTKNDMVLFDTPDPDSLIDTQSIPITETPRQMVLIPNTTSICLLTSDIVNGVWRSTARVIDLNSHESSEVLLFDEGLMVTSAAFLDQFSVVAVCLAKNLRFNPKKTDGGFVALLDISMSPPKIVQVSDFEEAPSAIASYGEFILLGVEQELMVLKAGKQRLLKKSCSKSFPRCITYIKAFGNRIIVGDSSESFHFVKFDKEESVLSIFADDMTPRFPLSALGIDRMTVACGDRFGNFTILRLPTDVSDEAEIDPSSVGHTFEHRYFAGAKNKLEVLANFHVGSPITGLAFSASKQFILYATVNGEIGVFVPLETDTEATLMRKLEAEMLQVCKSVVGRNIELFRSYYAPKKNVSDGSIVSAFLELPDEKQKEIADKLKVTPFDLTRLITKIESVF